MMNGLEKVVLHVLENYPEGLTFKNLVLAIHGEDFTIKEKDIRETVNGLLYNGVITPKKQELRFAC